MYPNVRTSSVFVVLAVLILFNGGCSDEDCASLIDPTTTTLPNSIITSVTPICSSGAGIETVVIQGTGFFGTLIDYKAFFKAQSGERIQATGRRIKNIAPLLESDSANITFAADGSFEFSIVRA